MAPLPTHVTATLANASERRSIAFEYQQTPIYYKPVTIEAPLDEKGSLAVELPFTEAQMVSVHLDDKVKLFLEPGDQLHLDADLLDLPQSLRFSGQGAANNFLAGIIVWDFEHGRFDQGEQRLAEFLQDNPYPEYTEVVEEVMRETAQAQTRPTRPRLHSRRSSGPKRLPERFQRPSGFPGLLVERVQPVHRRFSLSGKDQTADLRPEGRLPEYLLGLQRRPVAASSR